MRRVLVVDDLEENLYLLQVLLEGQGFEVELAHDGAEALEKARRDPPDLIVSDILMPVMDGFTLCRSWKADDRLCHVPFIFYTATYTDPRDEQLALNLGADAFITKPAEPEDFLAAVLAVLLRAETRSSAPVSEPVGEDGDILQQYSETLVRKLEDKMLQLEKANQALQREIVDRMAVEAQLRHSESRYRRLLESLRDGMAGTDLEGRLLEFNEAFRATLGYERSQLMTMNYTDLTPEKWRAFERDIVDKQVLTRGYSDVYEKEYLRADGSAFPVELRAVLERDEAGDPVGMWAVVRDISERKDVERSLMLTQFSVDHATDAVFWTDSAGRLLRVSDSTCRSLGYERDELLAMTLLDLDPTLSREQWSKNWERVKQEGSFAFETTHVAKDGKTFPVDVRLNYVAFEDAELNCVFARDITERRLTENALLRQAAFDELVEGLLSKIASASAAEIDGHIASALQPIASFVGVDSVIVFQASEDLTIWGATYGWAAPGISSVSETLNDIPMGTLAWVENELLAGRVVVLRSMDDLPSEAEGLRRLWVEQGLKSALMVPLRGRGALVRGCLALFSVSDGLPWRHQDVREAEQVGEAIANALERKRVEDFLHLTDEKLRQSQKMEAIGQLAGGIAHDFNNLLTAIIGYSDLILASGRQGIDDVLADVVEIKTAAERAGSLTRQILAFSRRQALKPEVVSLNEVVIGTGRLLGRTLGEDIHLRTLLYPQSGLVEVDVSQIEQVLMNLALNARDAMPEGGKLTIETANVELSEEYSRSHPEASPGSYVMLAVSDTGSGMSDETKLRAFEPFYTTKDPGKGTGLGLSTVYGTISQSGGSVSVYSEPGQGTTIKIYLPRVNGPKGEGVSKQFAPTTVTGSEAILLVEDEAAVRTLARRILTGLGYQVLEAANGNDALSLLREGRPVDLLLTDMVLPGAMQGNELSDAARDLRPNLNVLCMSGYTHDAIIHAGRLGSGANFLEKPFTPGALARRVRAALDGPVG